MINKQYIEAFYDYFDEIAEILFNSYQKSYLEAMNEAFNFLLDDSLEDNYSDEDIAEFYKKKEKIIQIEFSGEDVRKAVQIGLLKGYKHTYSSNALITPDTIGIFMSYLVKKLYANKVLETVLDPLIGTGNLVYTIGNHIDQKIKVFGVDNDIIKCNLARNLGDLINTENEIFFQDTLKYYDNGFDLIVMDMPILEQKEPYLPYQVINHHLVSLKDDGYLLAVIDNDFFEQVGSDVFRKEISEVGHIFGLIKLPDSMFKANPKSILIIRKKGEKEIEIKDFLLVDLPSFNDMENFNNTVNQIDLWFSEREEIL